MPNNSHHYWFKPKRFWGWFAAYYPVSIWGWIVFLVVGFALVFVFVTVDSFSHSVSDTLIAFAPVAIVFLIVVDFITRLKGEYPAWWKNKFFHQN